MSFPLVKSNSGAPDLLTWIGAPYHGVVVEGELDLTGSGGPLITGYLLGSDAIVNALSNPNRTLPTRSGGQITADAGLGRIYEPYALVANGNVYGKYTFAAVSILSFYFDSRGYLWSVTWDLSLDVDDETISGTVDFNRVFHIASGTPAADFGGEHTVTLSAVSVPGTDDGFGPASAALRVSDYTTSGDRVVFRTDYGIFEATLSDTIEESSGAAPYPYGGGTISFDVSFAIVKTFVEVTGTATGDVDVINHENVDQTGAIRADWGSYCEYAGNPFGDFCAYKTTGDPDFSEGDWQDYIFAVSYDQSNTLCYWSVSVHALGQTSYSPTNVPGGLQTMEASESVTIDIDLKRNGTTVDSKSMVASREYVGTSDLSTLPFSTMVSSRDMGTSMETDGITTASASISVSGAGIESNWYAGAFIRTPTNVTSQLIGPFALACKRIGAGTHSAADYSPVFFSPAGLTTSWTLEDLSPTGEGDMVGIGLARYRSNKFFGLASMSISIDQGVSDLTITGYNELLLGTAYSADSSQVPDTTVRTTTEEFFGLPLAYNPWTDTWHVSSWDSGEGRWQIVGFV